MSELLSYNDSNLQNVEFTLNLRWIEFLESFERDSIVSLLRMVNFLENNALLFLFEYRPNVFFYFSKELLGFFLFISIGFLNIVDFPYFWSIDMVFLSRLRLFMSFILKFDSSEGSYLVFRARLVYSRDECFDLKID